MRNQSYCVHLTPKEGKPWERRSDCDADSVDQLLAQSAVRFGATLLLESAIFKTEDS